LESAGWLTRGDRSGEALAFRWVDLDSREYRHHQDILRDLKGDLVRKGLQVHKTDIERLDQYQEDFQVVLIEFERLRTCPVCGQTTRQENFHPEGDGAFMCTCEQRNCAKWGLRKCGNCQDLFPFLDFGDIRELSQELQADWVDRYFGMDVLAAPCPSSNQVYLCPSCGTCGRDSTGYEQICVNCREYRTIINSEELK